MSRSILEFGALALLVAATACDHGPVVTQDTEAGEHAYRELSQRWLEWVAGQPWSTGPVNDSTGEQCASEQSGKVWLLAGTSGGAAERTCEIPRNKYVFFPLENIWSAPPPELVDTPEEEAEFIESFEVFFPEWRAGTCSLTLRLDGEDLLGDTEALDEETWVSILEPFEVELDEDNFGGEGSLGGTRTALIAGHWALLRPLEPGDHVLEFGGAICDGEEVYFETSVTYTLHVAE